MQGTASCVLLFMLSEVAALYVSTYIALYPMTTQSTLVQMHSVYALCSVHPADRITCSFIMKLLK